MMKKEILILLLSFALISSCKSPLSNTVKINITDSLIIKEGLGEIIERIYFSGNGDTLKLYSQQHSGDGVYALTLCDTTTYGKRYTLRGDAISDDATVYELRPFSKADTSAYFLYRDSTLVQLNKELEELNTVLKFIVVR